MNTPTKLQTLHDISQESQTAKIDKVIKRINFLIKNAASEHKNNITYNWYRSYDWEGTSTYYNIKLPNDGVDYVMKLFSSYGYRIEVTKRWWQLSNRYTFHWDYQSKPDLCHTINPVEIPTENIKMQQTDYKEI